VPAALAGITAAIIALDKLGALGGVLDEHCAIGGSPRWLTLCAWKNRTWKVVPGGIGRPAVDELGVTGMWEFFTALLNMLTARRAALAAFLAGALSLVALIIGLLPAPQLLTLFVVFVAVFGLVIFLYPTTAGRSKWRAWRARRSNAAKGVANLAKLDALEAEAMKWIYHHGGRFRASEADGPLLTLKNFHIIERDDPDQPYRDCILIVPKQVMRALRKIHGKRKDDLGGGTPPWRRRGIY